MAVYSIKNLHSEELNDRIALVESYYDVMNDDCALFKEQMMNEANIADIGKSLKERIDVIIKKVREVFRNIMEVVKKALRRIKEKIKDKAYQEKLSLFYNKARKKTIRYDKSDGIRPVFLEPFHRMLHDVIGYDTGNIEIDQMMRNYASAQIEAERNGTVDKRHIESLEKHKDNTIKSINEAIEKSNPENFFFVKDTAESFDIGGSEAKIVVDNLQSPDSIYDSIKNYFDQTEKNFKEYEKRADDIDKFFKEEAKNDPEDKSGIIAFLKELSGAFAEIVSTMSKYDTNFCTKLTSSFTEYINTLNKIVDCGLRK